MLQADAIATTIPSAPRASTAIYLPEIHHKTGTYFPELRKDDTSKSAIVADIATACQYEDVIRVIAIELSTGKSWDASKEIAQAVLDSTIEEYGHVPNWCLDFCQEHLGIGYVNRAEKQAA